jgi:hypothetical protein
VGCKAPLESLASLGHQACTRIKHMLQHVLDDWCVPRALSPSTVCTAADVSTPTNVGGRGPMTTCPSVQCLHVAPGPIMDTIRCIHEADALCSGRNVNPITH